MASKTDRNGAVTTYSYDTVGRLLSEDAGGEIQSYTYNRNGNLLSMTDATGTTVRKYDRLSRNNSKTVPDIGKATYEYDLASEETGGYAERTTDPKGNTTLKSYDRAGRLSKVTVGEGTTVYEYYANGNRSKITYPDGTTETYSYDRNNRVTGLINAKADGAIISSYFYTYDGAGNQLTKTEAKGTTSYTYDRLNRLSSVTEPEGKATCYTYDGAGNRRTEKVQFGLTEADTVYNYDNRNRLISTLSSGGAYTRYLYDSNGNLISRASGTLEPNSSGTELTAEDLPNFGLIIKRSSEAGTGTEDITLYTYDNYNRLTGTKSKDTNSSYRYNAQGYRVEKTVNGKTTKYLYEADKVVLETDGSNRQTAFQAYGSSLLYRTAAVDGEAGAQSYYYLYNAHGDVTSLIDAEGNIAVTYDYDAFGNILKEEGVADNSIRYAGYQYDEESGLYYLNARYYDSVTARFLSEDTYRGQTNDPLSLNLYTYCANNPIKYIDPTGHVANIMTKQTDNEGSSSLTAKEKAAKEKAAREKAAQEKAAKEKVEKLMAAKEKAAKEKEEEAKKETNTVIVSRELNKKKFDKTYTPTQADADAIVAAALNEYDLEGNKEENLKFDEKKQEWVGDNKTKYGEWYKADGQAWCAMFVSYCANEAGVLNSVIPKNARVGSAAVDEQSMAQDYIDAGRYNSSNSGYIPKAGDTIFIKTTGGNHTGIVVAYDPVTEIVYTVEGNSSNAVRLRDRSLDSATIVGYGWNGGQTYGEIPTDSSDGANSGTR